MDVARVIRESRRKAGLSQRALARAAKTSQPTLARYESGQVIPSLATLDRILRAAGSRLVMSLEPIPEPSALAREVLERNRDSVRDVLAQHGVSGARLFGSAAREEDDAASDLDLVVEMDQPTYVRLAALRADLEHLLGVPVDVTAMPLLEDSVRRSIEAEAVPL
jgi:uncharacterized protein